MKTAVFRIPWKWRQQSILKRRWIFIVLHCNTSKKITLFATILVFQLKCIYFVFESCGFSSSFNLALSEIPLRHQLFWNTGCCSPLTEYKAIREYIIKQKRHQLWRHALRWSTATARWLSFEQSLLYASWSDYIEHHYCSQNFPHRISQRVRSIAAHFAP